jgi:hypothetical protein
VITITYILGKRGLAYSSGVGAKVGQFCVKIENRVCYIKPQSEEDCRLPLRDKAIDVIDWTHVICLCFFINEHIPTIAYSIIRIG